MTTTKNKIDYKSLDENVNIDNMANDDIKSFDALKQCKTFTIANVARLLNVCPKNARARARKYVTNDDSRYDVLRSRNTNARNKHNWNIKFLDDVVTFIRRDDDK